VCKRRLSIAAELRRHPHNACRWRGAARPVPAAAPADAEVGGRNDRALTDLKAISLTATAKAAVSVKSADLQALTAAQRQVIESEISLKQIGADHPSTGPDASNYAALNALLAELA
jgi:hypothetical protein